jgi:hypothetical protein
MYCWWSTRRSVDPEFPLTCMPFASCRHTIRKDFWLAKIAECGRIYSQWGYFSGRHSRVSTCDVHIHRVTTLQRCHLSFPPCRHASSYKWPRSPGKHANDVWHSKELLMHTWAFLWLDIFEPSCVTQDRLDHTGAYCSNKIYIGLWWQESIRLLNLKEQTCPSGSVNTTVS